MQTMLTVVTQNSRLPRRSALFRRPDGVWFRLPALLGARRVLPGLTRLSCKIGYLLTSNPADHQSLPNSSRTPSITIETAGIVVRAECGADVGWLTVVPHVVKGLS